MPDGGFITTLLIAGCFLLINNYLVDCGLEKQKTISNKQSAIANQQCCMQPTTSKKRSADEAGKIICNNNLKQLDFYICNDTIY